jgi:hypothetical protein
MGDVVTQGVPWVEGIPAVEGAATFIAQLDRLARRRPRAAAPTVLLRGQLADPLVDGFRRRLLIDGKETVPHVLLDCREPRPPRDDPALVNEIANGLHESLPGGLRGMAGARGLRLPRYRRIRQVLEAPPARGDWDRNRRDLRDELYRRRGELGWPAGWLDALVGWIPAFGRVDLGVLALPAVALSRYLFGVRLKLGPRFRWFGVEVRAVTGRSRDFLGSALCLVANGPQRSNDALVRQVLTVALLRDLQAATRPSLLSPFRRRRATPFVVLLSHVADDSPGYRLLDTLNGIGPDTLGRSRRRRRPTLLVLASLAPELERPPAPVGSPTLPLEEAADVLAPVAAGRAARAEALVVDLPPDRPGSASDQDEGWLALNRKVQPMPVRGAVAAPVLSCLLVLVAGFAASPWPGTGGPCPDTWRADGQLLGLNDGTADCSFFADPPEAQADVAPAMREVEAAIAEQNAAVLADHDEHGTPYSTVVFLAPLTVEASAEHSDENALFQLRGLYLAQAESNDLAGRDHQRVLTRVLIANSGDQFAHGPEVATRIVGAAHRDRTIIGVVGISQSRDDSFAAVQRLGRARLPVVAGPVTGDDMVAAAPYYYFAVSPQNTRVSRVLTEFSRHADIVFADGSMGPPQGAVIVLDHTDAYSRSLAQDLFRDIGDPGTELISYSVEHPGAPVADWPAEVRRPRSASSLSDMAAGLCAPLRDHAALYFTSRSAQFEGMLDNIRLNPDCPRRYTIIGGSAVTKMVENRPRLMDDHAGVDLYYAAFASRTTGSGRIGDFIGLYDRHYHERSGTDLSDAALMYDAFTALQLTANNQYEISPANSAQALGDGRIVFDGASGHVSLGRDHSSDDDSAGFRQVPPDKPVLVLHAGHDAPVLACGQFSKDDQAHTTWGPARRPCPRDE